MPSCGCNRYFATIKALEQHQRDKAKTPRAGICGEPFPELSHVAALGGQASKPSPRPSTADKRDQWMTRDVGKHIRTIDSASLQAPPDTTVSSIVPSQLLCSYNWVNKSQATVYVPGGAAVWKGIPSLPVTIPPDSGIQFIDQNASRIPKYPFQVALDALSHMRPGFHLDGIDVLVNRNSLRYLLDFCLGRVPRKARGFRLNLFVAGAKTLVIERCEKSAAHLINVMGERGYGHNFEKRFTAQEAGLEDSSGHHRLLRYDLGHLSCAVRFEVDSCYEGEPSEATQKQENENEELPGSLTEALGAISLDSSLGVNGDGWTASTEEKRTKIHVIHKGGMPPRPQSRMAELKTNRNVPSECQYLPQLWFGRTPYLIAGVHKAGTVNSVKIIKAGNKFKEWEDRQTNQAALCKMVGLLSRLRDVVAASGDKACIALCEKGKVQLKVFESKGRKMPLPKEHMRRFWVDSDTLAL